MRQGTTPTHTFQLPFEVQNADKLLITYAQRDEVVLQKTREDCTVDGKTVETTLTQEETFQFDPKGAVQIQLRILTEAGDALVSEIMTVSVQRCLDGEVMR